MNDYTAQVIKLGKPYGEKMEFQAEDDKQAKSIADQALKPTISLWCDIKKVIKPTIKEVVINEK